MLEQRRRNVARLLLDNLHEWIPGFVLTAKDNGGGTEGLRRLRELRNDFGWRIEKRKMGRGTAYEYRLVRKPGSQQLTNVFGDSV